MAENKYYWIKLRTDFFDDDSPIDILLSQKNGSEYVCLYLKLCLATANKGGRLCNQYGEMIVPYNVEKIQRDMKYFSIDTVRVALDLYKKLGLVYEESDGVLSISGHEQMVGSETKWAEYKRNERIGQSLDNVQQRLEIRDKDIRDKENKNKESKKNKQPPCYFPTDEKLNEAFNRFIEHRKKLKKPMDEYKCELAVNKLNKLSSGDNDLAIAIIEQSISEGWQGLFELKKPKEKPQSIADKWANA